LQQTRPGQKVLKAARRRACPELDVAQEALVDEGAPGEHGRLGVGEGLDCGTGARGGVAAGRAEQDVPILLRGAVVATAVPWPDLGEGRLGSLQPRSDQCPAKERAEQLAPRSRCPHLRDHVEPCTVHVNSSC
jgi:hypothetical protein